MADTITRVRVTFAHCDPAGIAYYPRLLEICDAAIEAWTLAAIGVTRQAMHQDMSLALPTAALQADFAKVVEWGDELAITLATQRVGKSSVDLAVIAECAGERRFAISYTQVLMCMKTHKSMPWPQEWRARLEKELAA